MRERSEREKFWGALKCREGRFRVRKGPFSSVFLSFKSLQVDSVHVPSLSFTLPPFPLSPPSPSISLFHSPPSLSTLPLLHSLFHSIFIPSLLLSLISHLSQARGDMTCLSPSLSLSFPSPFLSFSPPLSLALLSSFFPRLFLANFRPNWN